MNLLFQSNTSDTTVGVVFVIFIIVGAIFYFIPSIIALMRGKSNTVAIIALNLFLGWSIVGWVVSLVWSLSSEVSPAKIVVNQQPIQKTEEDGIDKLTKLKKLLDEGAITQDEFDQQKAVLLKNS
ncbi:MULTISPECIES: superinfection immunity protein [Aquimarina]|uniref:Superinfection immunity protein n=1 Tax=Aquimarina algiphila TaxID=2047982 RepID=A0A554VRT7_9FLAO|nr:MULTISPECIES: superinfection immunity protein [Aquimarina]TSE11372.1 superinfection immunity protein [Aquimarina algiphila]